jgi:hypothetical protein
VSLNICVVVIDPRYYVVCVELHLSLALHPQIIVLCVVAVLSIALRTHPLIFLCNLPLLMDYHPAG